MASHAGSNWNYLGVIRIWNHLLKQDPRQIPITAKVVNRRLFQTVQQSQCKHYIFKKTSIAGVPGS